MKPSVLNILSAFKTKSSEVKLLIVLVLSLILIRFVLGEIYPVFSDACRYLYIAKHPSLLLNPHFNYPPPLLMLIGAAIYPLFGEFGLKLIAPFFGALGIIYTYKLGREIFDEKRGLIAAILLGIIPSHIYLSAMAYQDGIITGFLTAFIYYFYKAMTSEKGELKAGIIAGLTSLSKLTGVIVFPIIAFYYILNSIRKRVLEITTLKKCVVIGLVGLLIGSPYYLRTLYLFGSFMNFQVLPPKSESFSLTSPFGSELFNKDFSRQVVYQESPNIFDYAREVYLDFWGVPIGTQISLPNFVIPAFIIITIFASLLFLYGMIKGLLKAKDDKDKNSIFIYVWLLVWVVAILVLQRNLLWGFRRLLPMAPAIALLAAKGFDLNAMRYKKFFVLLLVFAVIIFPTAQTAKAWYAHNYFEKYSDALQYIKTLPADSIILIHDDEQCIFYAEKKAYNIGHLKPEYLNLTTLKTYNITHVVRFEHYLFYDLSEHVKRIDEMARKDELKLVWESEYVKIYKVRGT
jgi:4-amino-4-deoxy-L-arabinose transferase-like glycosyltransferase